MNKFHRFLSFKSIQTKMLLAILLLIVFPMLLITFISITRSERFLQEKISQSDTQMLSQISNNINSTLEAMMNASNMFTQDRQIVEILSDRTDDSDNNQFINAQKLDAQMDKAKNTNLLNFNSYFSIFDFNGNMYTSGPRRSGDNFGNYANSEWFKKTIENNGFALWSVSHNDYIKSEELGSGISITLSRLIKGSRSQGGYGIISISISEEEFYKKLLMQNIYEANDEVFIIDDKGIVLSHKDQSLLGAAFTDSQILQQIFVGGQKNFITKIEGEQKFISYAPIPMTGWLIVKVSSYDTIFKDLISIRNSNIFLIILISIVFSLVTTVIIFTVTRPIKKLQRSMELVEKGNLDIKVNVKGADEVAQLGINFNSMLSYINTLIGNIREKQKKEEELRLEVLQAQINPHFLFNTLNTIKWTAIISQSNHVASLIEALGRILEMSVKDMNKLISVQAEIENLESYLKLQKARYNQRFIENIVISDCLKLLKIPKLILQPLVENSIVHGLKDDHIGNLNIEIRAELIEDMMVFTVHDDGAGIDVQRLEEILDDNCNSSSLRNRFGHIGIQNVHKRIQLMFGMQYGLKIRSKVGEGTDVEVWLPRIEEEDWYDAGTDC